MKPLYSYQPPHLQGCFGAIRKHDIHTGIDLYCHHGSEVYSIEDGVVVDLGPFTGQLACPPTPWWHDTNYVAVQGKSGTILYGEITLTDSIVIGQFLPEATVLGHVLTVLKKDKGLPITMLHLELYSKYIKPVDWSLSSDKPFGLEDPQSLLDKG